MRSSNKGFSKSRDIRTVISDGICVQGYFFVFYLFPSNESKIAISISKKIGGAVYRNRVKRVVREVLRSYENLKFWVVIRNRKYSIRNVHMQKELDKVFTLFLDGRLQTSISLYKRVIPLKFLYSSQKMSLIARIHFFLILLYKKYLSSMFSRSCRYIPECSVYALEVLRTRSFTEAATLIIRRLGSCRPSLAEKDVLDYPPKPKQKRG